MVGQGHTDVYILDNSTRISFEYWDEIQNRVSDPALVQWVLGSSSKTQIFRKCCML